MAFATRAALGLFAASAFVAVGFTVPAEAQEYPARGVRVVVPFAAGGPADVYARIIAQNLQDALGQPFTVDNRPGAGALIGTTEAAKAPADGYTLLMMSNTHTTNESLMPNKSYVLTKDFVAVAPVNASDLVLVVHPSTGAKTLQDFVAQAKAKPGALNYASSGPGTPYHMAGELFKAMTATDIVHVPYKGSSGARNDIIGGHVQMMFDAVTTMTEAAKAGQVIALATSGKTRSAVLPDIPTLDEAGVKGYDATIWLGLMAPTGTPKAIVDKLNATVRKIQARDDIKSAWSKQGAEPLVMEPAAFEAYIKADIEKWAGVIKTANIKVQQ